MKIKKIEVKNFKAVPTSVMEFNGCSAIITAGNDKGKTSVLRGLIDRFRGQTPELIVKEGESKGYNIIELTDGAKIEWKFTEKTESFAFITKDGIKQTQGVLSTIGERYFGIRFDIDKFLNSTPKDQTSELQRIVGLDFADIDGRYKIAYDARVDKNRELKRVIALAIKEPEKIGKPNIEVMEVEKQNIENDNTKLKEQWKIDNTKQRSSAIVYNESQHEKEKEYNNTHDSYHFLLKFQNGPWNDCIDFEKAGTILNNIPKAEYHEFEGHLLLKPIIDTPEPEYKPLTEIEQKIKDANTNMILFNTYEISLQSYNDWVKQGTDARKEADEADKKVKDVEKEKGDLISSADIPKDFKITEEGIIYKGFPLTNSQTSSSSKYIAALKLGSMILGEIRTMHFDASFLDKNSLSEIQDWANKNDLQLLIERPDFDGGEIKYEIISK